MPGETEPHRRYIRRLRQRISGETERYRRYIRRLWSARRDMTGATIGVYGVRQQALRENRVLHWTPLYRKIRRKRKTGCHMRHPCSALPIVDYIVDYAGKAVCEMPINPIGSDTVRLLFF